MGQEKPADPGAANSPWEPLKAVVRTGRLERLSTPTAGGSQRHAARNPPREELDEPVDPLCSVTRHLGLERAKTLRKHPLYL